MQEIHSKQNLIMNCPDNNKDVEFFLFKNKNTYCKYNWTNSIYIFETKNKVLNITESRLCAFGTYIKNKKINEDYITKVIDYIECYENEFLKDHPERRGVKNK